MEGLSVETIVTDERCYIFLRNLNTVYMPLHCGMAYSVKNHFQNIQSS
jgi:hypothetical protein